MYRAPKPPRPVEAAPQTPRIAVYNIGPIRKAVMVMAHNIPEGYFYTKKHEWAREEDGLLVIGISDYAQDSLGDIVFVDAPEEGAELAAGDSFGAIESVKAAEDLYSPAGGVVAEVNEEVKNSPEKINQDAYANWILKLKEYNKDDLKDLMDSQAYQDYVGSLG